MVLVPHDLGILVVQGGVEEAGDHRDTAVLDVGADRVLFVVDEVLGEGVDHELLGLLLHVCGDEGCQAGDVVSGLQPVTGGAQLT